MKKKKWIEENWEGKSRGKVVTGDQQEKCVLKIPDQLERNVTEKT